VSDELCIRERGVAPSKDVRPSVRLSVCPTLGEVLRLVLPGCARCRVTRTSASSPAGPTGLRAVADVADIASDIARWKVSAQSRSPAPIVYQCVE